MKFTRDNIERIQTDYLNGVLFGYYDHTNNLYEWKWKSNKNGIEYYLFGIYDMKECTLEEATLRFIQDGAIGEYIEITQLEDIEDEG